MQKEELLLRNKLVSPDVSDELCRAAALRPHLHRASGMLSYEVCLCLSHQLGAETKTHQGSSQHQQTREQCMYVPERQTSNICTNKENTDQLPGDVFMSVHSRCFTSMSSRSKQVRRTQISRTRKIPCRNSSKLRNFCRI